MENKTRERLIKLLTLACHADTPEAESDAAFRRVRILSHNLKMDWAAVLSGQPAPLGKPKEPKGKPQGDYRPGARYDGSTNDADFKDRCRFILDNRMVLKSWDRMFLNSMLDRVYQPTHKQWVQLRRLYREYNV